MLKNLFSNVGLTQKKAHKIQKTFSESQLGSLGEPQPKKIRFLSKQIFFLSLCKPFYSSDAIINVEVGKIQFINQFQPQRKMSLEVQGKQYTLNRRQLYKNQKLQQINQIYFCECGKNYLTFSALYLHARNKHQVKLTTKRSNLNCKVQEKGEKTIITYFIQPKEIELPFVIQQKEKNEVQNTSQDNGPFEQMIAVTTSYLDQEKATQKKEKCYTFEVIEQFKKYLQQIKEMQAHQYPSDTEDLPLYFNEFVVYYLPLAHQQRIISLTTLAQAQNQMIKFWRWLRQNEYSTVQLLHRTYPPYFQH